MFRNNAHFDQNDGYITITTLALFDDYTHFRMHKLT